MNVISQTPKRVLMVVANTSVSTTLAIPVGFWAAELFHVYHEFTRPSSSFKRSVPNPTDSGQALPQHDERDAEECDVLDEKLSDPAQRRKAA
jgi:hypothetical protein